MVIMASSLLEMNAIKTLVLEALNVKYLLSTYCLWWALVGGGATLAQEGLRWLEVYMAV